MKKQVFLLSLVFILCHQISFAQYYYENRYDNDNRALYERKIVTYTKMKKTGWTVAAVGTGVTILGVILINSADWETTTNMYGQSQTTTDDPAGVLGIVGVTIGIPSAIAGVVIGIIGGSKQNEYMHKLERLDMSFQKQSDINMFRLAYRF